MPYAEVQAIRSSLNLDLSGTDAKGALPRYDQVSLDNEKFEGEKLTHLLGEDRCSYEIRRNIEGNQQKFVHVVNEISEIVRIPDTFVWSMNAPTEDATINITSSDLNVGFQVRALHPDSSARLNELVSGRRWTFRGGMLPWQGFEIRSFYRSKSQLTKPEEEQLQLNVTANAQQAQRPPSGESGL